jgi:hypothetical protein
VETYLSVFLIGLLGGMHCIGMCGGFVAMYSLRKPAPRPSLPYHLLYNLGRLTTYALLGGVMGLAGSFFSCLGAARGIPGGVLLAAGVAMVLMGLNSAGILGRGELIDGAAVTERGIFRHVLRRILALESHWGVYLFGLVLGLLPCGLLYPVFFSAAASGGMLSGALTMLAFGLGTVPAMLSLGMFVTGLRPHFRRTLYRLAALLIVLLGIQTVLRGMAFNGWIPPGPLW